MRHPQLITALLIPIAYVIGSIPFGLIVGLDPQLVRFVERMALALIIVVVVRALGALLTAVNEIYSGTPHGPSRPIKGYLQGLKIIMYSGAAIIMVSALLDQSPWLLLSGLGLAGLVRRRLRGASQG